MKEDQFLEYKILFQKRSDWHSMLVGLIYEVGKLWDARCPDSGVLTNQHEGFISIRDHITKVIKNRIDEIEKEMEQI